MRTIPTTLLATAAALLFPLAAGAQSAGTDVHGYSSGTGSQTASEAHTENGGNQGSSTMVSGTMTVPKAGSDEASPAQSGMAPGSPAVSTATNAVATPAASPAAQAPR